MNDNDHEQLHIWMLRALLAGSAASVLFLLLGRAGVGSPDAIADAFFVAIVVGAIVPPVSVVDGSALAILSIGAGAASRLSPRVALPIMAVAIGIGIARRLASADRLPRSLVLAIAGATSLAGLVVRHALAETGILTAALGPGLGTLAGGAVTGAIIGLGAIGRLLRRTTGPREVELGPLATEVMATNPEVGALLTRAAEAHRQAAEVVGGIPGPEARAAKAAADNLVLRLLEFGREWMEIERRANDTRPELLTARAAQLQTRLEQTTDPVAKAELGRAMAAVHAQAVAMSEILRGRERAVARLEHQVATLERFRLAALRHRSADAGRFQAELAPVVEELADAGGDYELASDALRDAEPEADVTAVPRTTN